MAADFQDGFFECGGLFGGGSLLCGEGGGARFVFDLLREGFVD